MPTPTHLLANHMPNFAKHGAEFMTNHRFRVAKREARRSGSQDVGTRIPDLNLRHNQEQDQDHGAERVLDVAALDLERKRAAWQAIMAQREAASRRTARQDPSERRSRNEDMNAGVVVTVTALETRTTLSQRGPSTQSD